MCDLGAWLPVMCSLWFILSFNLSSNLFATAVTQSRCHSTELQDEGNSIRRWHEAAFINGHGQMLHHIWKDGGGAFEFDLIPQDNV